jgi:hypothetical protein
LCATPNQAGILGFGHSIAVFEQLKRSSEFLFPARLRRAFHKTALSAAVV